jgi:anti-anti-sigma regulatory factor
MLRITVRNEPDETRFVVEGKLAGDSVGELEKCWHVTEQDSATRELLVDLSSVSFIDHSGKQLLARMHQNGIRIIATGLMPKCFLDGIEHKELKPTN